MNDPWKDIRATHFYHRDDLDVFSYEVTTAELNRLLADADALLALKIAIERFKADSWTFDPKHLGLTTWGSVLRALADLPSYLKGE